MLSTLESLLRRTRQHHAIEHATLHVLAARLPGRPLSGYSDPLGFTIFGDVDEADVRRAVGDALLRLQAGESGLAIHPNCGTGLVVSGVFATLAGFLAAYSPARRLDRFANGVVLVILALILAKPVGLQLQEYTTLAEVGDRWVIDVRPFVLGNLRGMRVAFEL
ncbi:MAG: DUF6391 domain-containing protein [Litorilinea sp.]